MNDLNVWSPGVRGKIVAVYMSQEDDLYKYEVPSRVDQLDFKVCFSFSHGAMMIVHAK